MRTVGARHPATTCAETHLAQTSINTPSGSSETRIAVSNVSQAAVFWASQRGWYYEIEIEGVGDGL